jgi:hypothetical protein
MPRQVDNIKMNNWIQLAQGRPSGGLCKHRNTPPVLMNVGNGLKVSNYQLLNYDPAL